MKEFVKIRPLFCACVIAFIIGIICSKLDSLSIFVLCAVILFSLVFVVSVKFELKKICVVAAIVSLIICVSSLIYTKYVYEPACEYAGRDVSAECVLITETESTSDGCYATVKLNYISDGKVTYHPYFKARLYFGEEIKLLPTTVIKADFTFADIDEVERFSSVQTYAYVEKDNFSVICKENKKSLLYNYHSLRKHISSLVPVSDEESAAFIKGMIFGDRSEISDKFSNRFTKIGMSHVMSVSGMHLIFAVMLFDVFLILFGVGYKTRAYVSLTAIILFTVVSGFAVSCVRSALMLCLYYIARILDEYDDGITSLSVSAIIILIFTPYNIFSVSYLLSISASFGLLVITPFLNDLFVPNIKHRLFSRIFDMIKSIFNMSLGANIMCLPVFIFVLGEVSLVAPIANLLLTLPIQCLFYTGFLGVILSFVPYVEKIVTAISKCIYDFIEVITKLCYDIKYSSVNEGYKYFYLVFFLFAVLIIATFIIVHKFPKKRVWPYYAVYAVFAVTMFTINFVTYHDTVRIDFVDVGQGSCTVATKSETAVIIDCGGTRSDKLKESLKFNTVKNVELLAFTHLDSDHISYIEQIVNVYEVKRIVYPQFSKPSDELLKLFDKLESDGTVIESVSADIEYNVLDGAVVSVFAQRAYNSAIDNNTSAMYKFEYEGNSALITGDADINQEYVYLKYGDSLDCDILLVAHHGSKKSCLQSALEQYSPDYSVISVSENNNYNMPNSATLSRLEKCSEVLRTDQLSTISFILNSKGYRLKR